MINFNLTFATNKDGFTPGQAQQDAMKRAVREWGSQFANDATIDLTVDSTFNEASSILMEAGSELAPIPTTGFGNVEVVRNKALTGKDLNGSERDGRIQVNWGKKWELDFNETPNAAEEEFDFYSTLYHELNHALGFLSQIGPFGRSPYLGESRAWGAFDQYITDSKGDSIFEEDGRLKVAEYQKLSKGGNSENNSGLFFSGPNAKAANGGSGVGLYTPEDTLVPVAPSHLDDENPDLDGSLMDAKVKPGPSTRTLSEVEKAIFKDLGYAFAQSPTDPPTDPPEEPPVNPSAESPTDESTAVELTSLGDGNTVALQLDQAGVSDISDLRVFKADDAQGQNQIQIASFSILEGGKLPDDYAPSFTLNSEDISVGKFLQFELVENGESRSATPTFLDDDTVLLDFGGGTVLSSAPTTDSETTNVLLDDAATIDLSQQNENSVDLSFSVYRSASYDNTVGFYQTDSADGAIVTDPILGVRVRPGEAGYREAALNRALDTRLTGENGQVKTFSAEIEGGFLGTFLISDGSDLNADNIFFSHGAANSNGDDYVKMLGNNTFGFEDIAGLGDKDYNDVVVKFDIA